MPGWVLGNALPRGAPPTVCCSGEEEQFDDRVSGVYTRCSRWGNRGIEWQNRLPKVTELGFTPRSVRSQQPVV